MSCWKNSVTSIVVLFAFFLVGSVYGQKKTLAIGNIEVSPAVAKRVKDNNQSANLAVITDALQTQFVSALNETRKFQMINRDRLNEIRKEQEFTDSGLVDLADENRAKLFKLAGVQYFVFPSIYEFADVTKQINFNQLGRQATRRIVTVKVMVQISDTTTGKTLETANIEVEKVENQASGKFGNGNTSVTVFSDVAEELAYKIAQRVVDVIYPAKLLSVLGKNVTINRGDGTGIEQGQIYEIYAVGEELIDPDTNESLGRDEFLVGEVRIVRVTPLKSLGQIIGENMGIAKGSIARLKKTDIDEQEQEKEESVQETHSSDW